MGFLNWLRRLFGRRAGVLWGKYRIPDDLTPYHFLAAGATGTGKTTLLRMLLRSVFEKAAEEPDTRILLYDPKSEWSTEIADMGLAARRVILNPFDARSVAWDMAADIVGFTEAQELASLMFPPQEGANKFFYDASRKLVTNAIMALVKVSYDEGAKRSRWTFRDLLLACENINDLRKLFERAGLPTGSIDDFLTEEREARSVRMTVSVENDAYNSIAAAWTHAEKAISLHGWVKGNDILLLGASKRFRTALATVNRLIVQRLQQLAMDDHDPSPDRRSWFFIDEFPSLGRIPHLEELLTEGRGRGICVVLGFQHISHVRQLYRDVAEALLGQCYHQAFFAALDEEMARWVSSRFAPLATRNPEKPWIVNESPAVTRGEVMSLPEASPKTGFTCIIKSVRRVVDGPKLIHIGPGQGPPWLRPARPGDKDYAERARFIPRPREELTLEPWSPEEREKLGLDKKQIPGPGVQWASNPEGGFIDAANPDC